MEGRGIRVGLRIGWVMADFGQTDFGQFWCFGWFWCGSVLNCLILLVCCVCVVCVVGVFRASWDSPSPGPPFPWTAQNFALFFPLWVSHHSFLFFFPSLLVFLVEFWWCLKRRDAQMCTLGLSCETPAAPPDRAAGARTRQPENSPSGPPPFGPPTFRAPNPSSMLDLGQFD